MMAQLIIRKQTTKMLLSMEMKAIRFLAQFIQMITKIKVVKWKAIKSEPEKHTQRKTRKCKYIYHFIYVFSIN